MTTKTKTTTDAPPRWILPAILALWALVPELRRIVDWQVGFSALPVINLIPLAALAALAPQAFRRRPPDARTGFGFVAAAWMIGFGYAFLVAVLSGGRLSAIYEAGQFILPFFAAIVVVRSAHSERTFAGVATTLAWLGIVVGAYGILQYVAPPPWDVLWVENSGLSSIGTPVPFGLRVFSTLNSPGACGDFFAFAFLAQLPYLHGRRVLLRAVALAFIIAGLALTFDRSAWLAAALGAVVYALMSPQRWGAVIAFVVIGVLGAVTIASGPAAFGSSPAFESIGNRLTSLGDVQSDESVTQRQEESREALHIALTEPFGQGLGALGTATKLSATAATTTLDNGYLSRFVEMGVFGFAAYLIALGAAFLFSIVRTLQVAKDAPQLAAVGAACVALQAALLLLDLSSDHHSALAGTIFWIAVAVPLALRARTPVRAVAEPAPRLQFAR